MSNDREKANCKRKVRFSSDLAAQNALKKINPARANKGPNRVYKCPICFGWHLSSQPKH